jgi:hypothetical protein
MPTIPDWVRAHGSPEIQGHIRQSASDFEVTEVLDYALSGEGEHDYLWLEKQDANTAWVAGKLAAHAAVRESEVGFAGLKDRHAVTRQWFSVRRPTSAGTNWNAFELPGVRIESLRLSVHDGNVIIQGEKERPELPGPVEFQLAERGFGAFRRVIQLGIPVNTRLAKATLNNGLLRICFPKVPNRRGAAVPIEVASE